MGTHITHHKQFFSRNQDDNTFNKYLARRNFLNVRQVNWDNHDRARVETGTAVGQRDAKITASAKKRTLDK